MIIHCVCGWDTYYPGSGIENVLAAFTERDNAEIFLLEYIANKNGLNNHFDHMAILPLDICTDLTK